ncbi:Amino-acid permease GAP3 [Fusarium oxysporum f. sp. albedinis]|nr:Amino-acid permease GAP3 [Fusarium oxysporum f. sp. albedinis]
MLAISISRITEFRPMMGSIQYNCRSEKQRWEDPPFLYLELEGADPPSHHSIINAASSSYTSQLESRRKRGQLLLQTTRGVAFERCRACDKHRETQQASYNSRKTDTTSATLSTNTKCSKSGGSINFNTKILH